MTDLPFIQSTHITFYQPNMTSKLRTIFVYFAVMYQKIEATSFAL